MSRVAIFLKAIKPAKLQVGRIRLELLNELRKEGTASKKELRKTVVTWKGAKPTFEDEISLAGNDATLVVHPAGSEEGISKWHFLEAGTRVRWALMSGNWKSKTKPGSFKSGGGRGRMVFAGRKAFKRRGMKPRPGIKARGWTTKLMKERKTKFASNMEKACRRGAERAYD
jgi:hypothetical protein